MAPIPHYLFMRHLKSFPSQYPHITVSLGTDLSPLQKYSVPGSLFLIPWIYTPLRFRSLFLFFFFSKFSHSLLSRFLSPVSHFIQLAFVSPWVSHIHEVSVDDASRNYVALFGSQQNLSGLWFELCLLYCLFNHLTVYFVSFFFFFLSFLRFPFFSYN